MDRLKNKYFVDVYHLNPRLNTFTQFTNKREAVKFTQTFAADVTLTLHKDGTVLAYRDPKQARLRWIA